ncbi:MAG: hypothetical protein AB1607_03105 [Chloroflexota bacterium]
MVTVQFKSKIKNGVIEIPKKYKGKLRDNVRVILRAETPKGKSKNYLDTLLAHPVKVKKFSPITREQIYAR